MSSATNILLVDDEPGMLRYIRTLLEVDDYKVETASTGEEAVERVQKGLQPDLVLLDLLMPGMGGIQALTGMRNSKANRKTPVIIVSVMDDAETKIVCQSMGVVDYIVKPIEREVIVRSVEAALSR